jgi:hypothetical protein
VIEDHEKTGGLNIKSVVSNSLNRRATEGCSKPGPCRPGFNLPYRDCYKNSTFDFNRIEQAGAVTPLDQGLRVASGKLPYSACRRPHSRIMTHLIVAVFLLVHLGIIFGGLPFVQLGRAGIALPGAIALVATLVDSVPAVP